MIKRGSKKNLITRDSSSEKQETPKRDIGTVTDETTAENFRDETTEMAQSPVFHIHIHVPECSKENQTKMYLPRIQPIIHLHYDKLAKKLSDGQGLENRELNRRFLQRVVSQATPKFGNVLFHYQNISYKNDFNERELISSTPQRVLRSRKTTNDSETNNAIVSNVVQSEISEPKSNSESTNKSDSNFSHNDVKSNSKVESSNSVPPSSPPIKLKKAVVVLEDISKLKSYKDCLSAITEDEKQNKVVFSPQNSVLNEMSNSSFKFKEEYESHSSRSSSPVFSEKSSETSDEDVQNSICSKPCSKVTNCEVSDEEDTKKQENLASLVEGCNFSEILRKFKGKDIQLIANSLKNSKYLVNKKKEKIEDVKNANENENIIDVKNNLQTEEKHSNSGLQNKEKNWKEEEEESTVKCLTNNSMEKAKSNKIEIKLHTSSHHKMSECCTGASDLSDSNYDSAPTLRKVFEMLVNKSSPDKPEITTRRELSSKINENCERKEYDSDEKDIIIKNEFHSPDTMSESSLVDIEDQSVELELSKKETSMNQKADGKEKLEKRKQSLKSNSSLASPAKKKIKSVEESEMSKEGKVKSSVNNDYIPLNVSGPTKFAVACLPYIQAYKTHDAKNFKNDMMFGSRVHRFNDSNHLRVLKMKKQAAGRRCD